MIVIITRLMAFLGSFFGSLFKARMKSQMIIIYLNIYESPLINT